MGDKLKGQRIAILVTDGFEEIELASPKQSLESNGAAVDIISPSGGKVRAWNRGNWGDEYEVDLEISKANPEDYDALMLPGGVINSDKLRQNKIAVDFAKAIIMAGKPVAAICHGPQLLIETDALEGVEMTSYPAIRTDLENAGAKWVNLEAVVDRGFVTSRKPADLTVFNTKMVEEFSKEKYRLEKA